MGSYDPMTHEPTILDYFSPAVQLGLTAPRPNE